MDIFLLALAPGLAICFFIYYQDKHDPEPKRLLIMSFLLGVLSVIPATLATKGIKYLFNIDHTNDAPDLDQLYYAFMAVAFSEEASKFIALRWFAYPKKEFDEPFDGITYSVMISMGFATVENFLYLYNDQGLSTGIHRMFTAVPGHASFAVVMGYYVGLSKFSHKNYPQWIGLLGAIVLHGLYDACLFLRHYPVMVIIAVLIVAISIFYSLKAIRLHQENSPFNNKDAI
ncbi:MAG: YpdC [Chitinophagaceae bacterium]|nr:YpdC [Chitinophagaceae bacterium]